MTLLQATSVLVSVIKERGLDDDRLVKQAVKRMEKRLRLLKLRASRTRLNIRHHDWEFVRFAFLRIRSDRIGCPVCKFEVTYGVFLSHYERRGRLREPSINCPRCNHLMIGQPHADDCEPVTA